MRLYDLTKMSTRMFKARTSRTILTIMGMGVGIGAILFLVALGYGIQRTLLETITTNDSLLSLDVYPDKSEEKISLQKVEEISTIAGVEQVSPVSELAAQIKYNDVTSDTKAIIIDDKFLNLNGTKVVKGKGIDNSLPGGVVISTTFAKIFGKDPEAMMNEEFKLNLMVAQNKSTGEKSKTIEVETPFKVIGFTENKENLIYLNKEALTEVSVISDFSRLKIRCVSGDVMENIRQQLTSSGLMVSALTDVVKQVDKVFKVVRVILGFFGMIALLVSAIGMFNTMTVSLLERTEEIGIMKSIGASDYDILWMFVFESTIMGFLGGISGIIMGIITSKFFNILVNFLAERFGGGAVSLFYYPLWFLGFILMSATVVGFFTGIIPAKRASSTDPLNALRYK